MPKNRQKGSSGWGKLFFRLVVVANAAAVRIVFGCKKVGKLDESPVESIRSLMCRCCVQISHLTNTYCKWLDDAWGLNSHRRSWLNWGSGRHITETVWVIKELQISFVFVQVTFGDWCAFYCPQKCLPVWGTFAEQGVSGERNLLPGAKMHVVWYRKPKIRMSFSDEVAIILVIDSSRTTHPKGGFIGILTSAGFRLTSQCIKQTIYLSLEDKIPRKYKNKNTKTDESTQPFLQWNRNRSHWSNSGKKCGHSKTNYTRGEEKSENSFFQSCIFHVRGLPSFSGLKRTDQHCCRNTKDKDDCEVANFSLGRAFPSCVPLIARALLSEALLDSLPLEQALSWQFHYLFNPVRPNYSLISTVIFILTGFSRTEKFTGV